MYVHTYICMYVRRLVALCLNVYIHTYVLYVHMYVHTTHRRITTVNSWLQEHGVDVEKVWRDIEVCMCCKYVHTYAYVWTSVFSQL